MSSTRRILGSAFLVAFAAVASAVLAKPAAAARRNNCDNTSCFGSDRCQVAMNTYCQNDGINPCETFDCKVN